MKRFALLLGLSGLLAGCVPPDLTQPTFPPVPPEKSAAKDVKSRTDDKPVNANEVTDRTAKQSLRDLDREIERELDRASGDGKRD